MPHHTTQLLPTPNSDTCLALRAHAHCGGLGARTGPLRVKRVLANDAEHDRHRRLRAAPAAAVGRRRGWFGLVWFGLVWFGLNCRHDFDYLTVYLLESVRQNHQTGHARVGLTKFVSLRLHFLVRSVCFSVVESPVFVCVCVCVAWFRSTKKCKMLGPL